MWCNNLAHICSPMQFSNAGMSCAERQLLAVASCLGKHSAQGCTGLRTPEDQQRLQRRQIAQIAFTDRWLDRLLWALHGRI